MLSHGITFSCPLSGCIFFLTSLTHEQIEYIHKLIAAGCQALLDLQRSERENGYQSFASGAMLREVLEK